MHKPDVAGLAKSAPPEPDPRIAPYVAEVSKPGVPYVNSSHTVLFRLGCEHGHQLVQDLLDQHWAAMRAYDARMRALPRICRIEPQAEEGYHCNCGLGQCHRGLIL